MRKVLLFVSLFVFVGFAQAQQPYGGLYHPEDLKNWVAGADANDVFNVSTVALQPRFVDENIKANANTSFSDAQVGACLTLAKNCSQGFSQGKNSFDEMYTFDYWQYLDLLVWWGGSAGEGVFINPTGPAIDAAHRSGTKILGNIFFAPGAFGGESEWVTQTLEKDGDGNFIIADKLIEVANYFGFDGWFLNEETNHFAAQADWTEFCAYFSANSGGLELQMYNANSSFGESQKWTLKDESDNTTGTSYFVNYGGTGGVDTHTAYVESIGLNKNVLYYGMNQGLSPYSNNSNIHSILDDSKASVQLFIERSIFRIETSGDCGNDAYDLTTTDIENFFNASSKYWSGGSTAADHNPSIDRSADAWSGMANMVPARTTIQNKPFVTSFNSGYGNMRMVEGVDEGVADQIWTHQSMQDMLPTWRWWWIDDANKELTARLTLSDAYEGGTSVKIAGTLNANDANELNLYKTKLSIESGDMFRFVFKNTVAGVSNVKVGLTFTDDYATPVYLNVADATGDWDKVDIDLSAYAGKTLAMISLKYESATGGAFESHVGQLGVYSSSAASVGDVSNVQLQKELDAAKGDLRITWDAASGDVLFYNVYLEKEGDKKLVGQTPSIAYYVPEFVRSSPAETSVKISIVPVSLTYVQGNETTITSNWASLPAPDVKLVTNTSFTTTGTEVTVVANATNFPTAYTWTHPAGATVVSETGNTVVYSFAAEGVYDVTIKVDNQDASTDLVVTGLITVNDTETLTNVALNKTIADHNGHYSTEAPENLIDGVIDQGGSNKWCYGGENEHYVVIDLGTIYDIYKTHWLDGEVNEPGAGNISNYRTYVSMTNNGSDWVEIYDYTDREAEDEKTDHFAGVEAQYVKFVAYDENDPLTIRIWEFEVFGKEAVSIPSLTAIADIAIVKTTTTVVNMPYDLDGIGETADFAIDATVTDGAENITIDDVVTEGGNIKLTITGVDFGASTVLVELTNNGMQANESFSVIIDNPAWLNLALNQTIAPIGDAEGDEETNDRSAAVDGDELTFWSPKSGIKSFTLNLNRICDVYKLKVLFTDQGAWGGEIPTEIDVKYSLDSTNGSWTTISGEVVGDEVILVIPGLSVQYLVFETNLSGLYQHCAMYEVVVNGTVCDGKPVSITNAADFDLGENATQKVNANYKLGYGGVEGDLNVAVSVSAGADYIELGTVTAADGSIAFDVKGLVAGVATIEIAVTNDGATITESFDVTVIANGNPVEIASISDVTLKETKVKSIATTYVLGSAGEAADFGVEVTATTGADKLTISNIVLADGNITFDLTGVAEGAAIIDVVLTNDGASLTQQFNINVVAIGSGAPDEIGTIVDFDIKLEENKAVATTYVLGEKGQVADFAVNVIASEGADKVEISNIVGADGNISFDVTGKIAGDAVVDVKVTNDGVSLTGSFTITVLPSGKPTNLAVVDAYELYKDSLPVLTGNYVLAAGGVKDDFDFSATVTSGAEVVEVIDATTDNGKFNVSLKGLALGSANVELIITNDGVSITKQVAITVVAYGRPISIGDVSGIDMYVDSVKSVATTYFLNGGDELTDFNVAVVAESGSEFIEISNITADAGKINFDIKGLKDGSAVVEITVTNDGASLSKKIIVSVTTYVGVNDRGVIDFGITAQPTVFSNQLNLDLQLESSSYVNIDIYNICGKPVGEIANGQFSSGKHAFVFDDATFLSNGVYFVNIRTEFGDKTIKVIKN